jgi:hypothetical protein
MYSNWKEKVKCLQESDMIKAYRTRAYGPSPKNIEGQLCHSAHMAGSRGANVWLS